MYYLNSHETTFFLAAIQVRTRVHLCGHPGASTLALTKLCVLN